MSDVPDLKSERDWGTFLEDLARDGAGAIFRDQAVRDVCLASLNEMGCRPPANHVVFFCLRKALETSAAFGGAAARSRLAAFLQTNTTIAPLFRKLEKLHREAKDRNQLKDLLLRELAVGAAEVTLDAATPMEVVVALHTRESIAHLQEEYRDLVGGLQSDIATWFHDVFEPNLSWGAQRDPRSLPDLLRYNSGVYGLLGRDSELDELGHFLGDLTASGPLHNFRWLLLTAPGGEGKTRLALEFVQRAGAPWRAGKLSHADLRRLVAQGRWRPRQPTLMVIDYPAHDPEAVRELLIYLQSASDDLDFPVRVLLLEREASGHWFERLLPEGGDSAAIREHVFRRDRYTQGWRLTPLSSGDIAQLMQERFNRAGVSAPSSEDLFAAAIQVDPRVVGSGAGAVIAPRPLFAAAVAEVLVTLATATNPPSIGDALGGLTQEGVFESIIERERAQRWRPAGADSALLVHENLLALATMCSGIEVGTLANSMTDAQKSIFPDLRSNTDHGVRGRLLQAMGSREPHAFIDPLEPDLLGEYFVLSVLRRLKRSKEHTLLTDVAFSAGGEYTANFVARLVGDLVADSEDLKLIYLNPMASAESARTSAAATIDIAYLLGASGRTELLAELLLQIRRASAARLDDEALALRHAQALVNVTFFSDPPNFTSTDDMMECIDQIRAGFEHVEEVVVRTAAAVANIVGHDARLGHWQDADDRTWDLKSELARFPDNARLAESVAVAIFNVGTHAGEQSNWDRVEIAVNDLRELRRARPEDATIADREAKLAANICLVSGVDWTRVDSAMSDIQAARQRFIRDVAIARTEALALCNVVFNASRAADWKRVNAALLRLDKVKAAFPGDYGIGLWEAKAAFSISGVPCRQERLDDVLKRLDVLSALFPFDREIAVGHARAIANTAHSVSQSRKWKRVNTLFDRLDEIRSRFSKDDELAAVAAKTLAGVASAASAVGAWGQVDAVERRLDDIRASFGKNSEVALYDGMFVVDVSSFASEASDWGRVDALLSRLDTILEEFPTDKAIEGKAAQAASNLVGSAAKSGAWPRVDLMLVRLAQGRARLPDEPSIAWKEAEAAVNITHSLDAGSVRIEGLLARLALSRTAFPEDRKLATLEAMVLANIASATKAQDWATIEGWFARIDASKATYRDDREFAVAESRLAFCVAGAAVRAGHFAYVCGRVDELRSRFPGDASIALNDAKLVQNASAVFAEEPSWRDSEAALLARLDGVLVNFAADQEVAVTTTRAVVNLCCAAGKSSQWAIVDALLARIDDARTRFPRDREIALGEALAIANITVAADGDPTFGERAAPVLQRAQSLKRQFPRDRQLSHVLRALLG